MLNFKIGQEWLDNNGNLVTINSINNDIKYPITGYTVLGYNNCKVIQHYNWRGHSVDALKTHNLVKNVSLRDTEIIKIRMYTANEINLVVKKLVCADLATAVIEHLEKNQVANEEQRRKDLTEYLRLKAIFE